MTFEARNLNLADPERGYLSFVLSAEARLGCVSSSLNAELGIEEHQTATPHFQEWLSRLERCTPNAMHCTLVAPTEIPCLFHPCVAEDNNSPAAIAGSGCRCRRAFYDPDFGLSVVGDHLKHARQRHGPVELQDVRPARTAPRRRLQQLHHRPRTVLGPDGQRAPVVPPQKRGVDCGTGHNGGGPRTLASCLTQIARNDGGPTPAGNRHEEADPAIFAWRKAS
ncbi:hypothetical protein ABZ618_32040 [Streptomyces roseolus]|uniref:hypothetical protein n=1 Tax=Streptomyces roseolus TaxID=67358 RepID=UPI0033E5D4F9